ncbi:MAG: Hsp20/alpha crystallin family protein [Bacteroidales bacterium]
MTLLRRANSYPYLYNWLEDILVPFTNGVVNNNGKQSVPAVNISEKDDRFEIELAAPGMEKSDFRININNDLLTIKSEKNYKDEVSNSNYSRKEFSYSAFERSFTLPDNVDSDNIKAGYVNGILNLEIPKKEEAKIKPVKEIEIA